MLIRHIIILILFPLSFSETWADENRITNWPNGILQSECKVVRGKLNGIKTSYYQSAKKHSEVEYKDDKENGKEIKWRENGTKESECEYKLGKKNGKAITLYENGGKKTECEYRDGDINGMFVQWHLSGVKESESEYRNGKKNGKETTWYLNGTKESECEYKLGKMMGKKTGYFLNGSKEFECDYREDERNGKQISWNDKGIMIGEIEFKNGAMNGKTINWNEDGVKSKEMEYKNGDLNGLYTMWYGNGQKKEEYEYVDGKKFGKSISWYENGAKRIEVEFRNNSRNGMESKWNDKGVMLSEVEYKNGLKNGKSTEWSPDGKVVLEQEYKNGEMIKNYLTAMPIESVKNNKVTEEGDNNLKPAGDKPKEEKLSGKDNSNDKNQAKTKLGPEEVSNNLTANELEVLENSNIGKLLRKSSRLIGGSIFIDIKESYLVIHCKDKKIGIVFNEDQSKILKSSFDTYKEVISKPSDLKENPNGLITSIGTIKVKKVFTLFNDKENEIEIKEATVFLLVSNQGENLEKPIYTVSIPKLKSIKDQIVNENTQRCEFQATEIENVSKAIVTKIDLEKQLLLESK